MPKEHSDIGLIGLAVMGQNLALNIADHGFQISVYNRTTSKMEDFVSENPAITDVAWPVPMLMISPCIFEFQVARIMAATTSCT